MTTALVSALTKVPVRSDVAMTGEITLRGKVTAIGGLKEKLLAALRGGIRTVLIPEENRKDLADLPKTVTQQLKIVPVRWIDEVLDLALERPIAPANAVSALGDGVKKAKADAKPERGRKKRAGDGARDAEKSANRNTRGAVKH
jgi:ATP-dependent Lon protease